MHGSYDVTLQYPKNVVVNVSDKHNTGLKFIGDEGWIWVTREGTGATSSDPQAKGANLPPLAASDEKLLDPAGLSVTLPVSKSHHKNWLEGVIARKPGLTPARRAQQQHGVHRELDRDEARSTARLGSQGGQVPQRRRSERAAHAQRTRSVWRAPPREGLMRLLKLLALGAAVSGLIPGAAVAADKDAPVQLLTLDPGHFHAALVQKFMLPGVVPDVLVFGPEGEDVSLHMKRIEGFNGRAENPTRWKTTVYQGADYLERLLDAGSASAKAGRVPVVVISGTCAQERVHPQSIERGFHVMADKPMVIVPDDLPKLEAAFAAAKRNNVLLYDIMTERFEIATMLQKALSRETGLFGTIVKGTPDEPAISKISVHNFSKIVAGAQLKRPQWFFDPQQQGAGIVDVMTHLVDLVQWEVFPDVTCRSPTQRC